jgi:hypothetical protein
MFYGERLRRTRRPTMRQFIRANAEELRRLIRKVCPNVGALDESALHQWVMNDEGLYLWAKSEGVRV